MEPPTAPSLAAADDVVGVYLTFPDVASAEAVATALVDGRMAACVNVGPAVTSHYRWQGRVQRDPEVVAWAKTTRARLPELVAAVRARHPYDVPCVVAYAVSDGFDGYLDWVRTEVEREA